MQEERRQNGQGLKISNITTKDPTTIADALTNHFGEASSINRYSDTFIRGHPAEMRHPSPILSCYRIMDQFNVRFTMEELTFALRKAKCKSVGLNDIA